MEFIDHQQNDDAHNLTISTNRDENKDHVWANRTDTLAEFLFILNSIVCTYESKYSIDKKRRAWNLFVLEYSVSS